MLLRDSVLMVSSLESSSVWQRKTELQKHEPGRKENQHECRTQSDTAVILVTLATNQTDSYTHLSQFSVVITE